MPDLSNLLLSGSARAIGSAIASGQVSSQEVTQWYLNRIERLNPGPRGVNCVRNVSPLALQEAVRADKERAEGLIRGPLHGVPYLVKDNVFTVDGCPASAGSKALAGFLPPYEATLVRRLRDAGAVLLGKANLTEFADFVSDVMPSEFSGAGGVVRNLLGHRYDRGQGSSVGSAASVAARFCAFAIGTETQNSIQTPAVHSSVVGFKPTVGRVSRHGVVPLVPSQDAPGPLAVTVEDAALVFSALAGADVNDSLSLSYFPDAPSLLGTSLEGMRIGVPRKFIADTVLDDGCRAAFDSVLQRLACSGAYIADPCDLPSAEQLNDVRSSVFRTEFKESLNALLGALQPCGISSIDDLIAWNKVNPDAIPYGQSLLEAASQTTGLLDPRYVADRQRDLALSLDGGIRAALQSADADFLLAPMSAAAKCTGKAGGPVVAIPTGRDAAGRPFGITIFAPPGQDRLLLRAAAAIEKAVGERIEPALD
ncbi:amidase family protein [Pusillimonas noertemannii]|uniref:Amidase n=1 Tax=Pusillimonas noertemannii TaxID=305977 RepID=A0A2U1CKZ0_9BURK|nr:amidase family protein [Pusillimonas noertemannii]NYT69193.1 amidase [Pusillimonas noertemannii]PVY61661.1 amidase [Pusillimonas noertemannii]TFL09602.1 amidase [Pusillimonas noertemannii]